MDDQELITLFEQQPLQDLESIVMDDYAKLILDLLVLRYKKKFDVIGSHLQFANKINQSTIDNDWTRFVLHLSNYIDLEQFDLFNDLVQQLVNLDLDQNQLIDLQLQILHYYMRKKDFPNVQAQIIKLDDMILDPQSLHNGKLFRLKSYYNMTLGKYTLAMEELDQAFPIYLAHGYTRSLGEMYKEKSRLYYNQNDVNNGLQASEKSIKIFKELQDFFGIASTKYLLGSIYVLKRDYDQAERIIKQAMDYFAEHDHLFEEMYCCPVLGQIYMRTNQADKAIYYYQRSTHIAEQFGDRSDTFLSSVYNSLGNLQKDKGKYPEAETYYLKSLELLNKLQIKRRIADATYNISHLYFMMGNLKLSLKYANMSESITNDLKLERLLPSLYFRKATIKFTSMEFDESLDLIDTGLEIAERFQIAEDILLFKRLRIKIFIATNNREPIEALIDEIETLSEHAKDPLVSSIGIRLRASYLERSDKTIDKFRALEIYREILQKYKNVDFIYDLIFFQYLKLLLLEFTINKSHIIDQELKDNIERMVEFSRANHSLISKVELFLILVRIHIQSENYSEARLKLLEIEDLVSTNDLPQYQLEIAELKESVKSYQFGTKPKSIDIYHITAKLNELSVNYSLLFHELRFSILKILEYENKKPRAELIDLLDVKPSTFTGQLNKLEESGLVSSSYAVYEGKLQKIVEITHKGIMSLLKFKESIVEDI